jgi:hypothetical protein
MHRTYSNIYYSQPCMPISIMKTYKCHQYSFTFLLEFTTIFSICLKYSFVSFYIHNHLKHSIKAVYRRNIQRQSHMWIKKPIIIWKQQRLQELEANVPQKKIHKLWGENTQNWLLVHKLFCSSFSHLQNLLMFTSGAEWIIIIIFCDSR